VKVNPLLVRWIIDTQWHLEGMEEGSTHYGLQRFRHAVTARLSAQPIESSVSLRAGRPGSCTPTVVACY
jgi:hypothetical protein